MVTHVGVPSNSTIAMGLYVELELDSLGSKVNNVWYFEIHAHSIDNERHCTKCIHNIYKY